MAPLHILVAAAALSALAAGFPLDSRDDAQSDTGCNGVHILVARGSYEPAGEGVQASVAQNIIGRIAGSSSAGIDYPAVIQDPPYYDASVAAGVENTKSQIQQYVNKCGDKSQIVLLGYSQGGNVMTDVLVGGNNQPALDNRFQKYIKAAAVFGDPGFVAGVQPIDAGNATTTGRAPRDAASEKALQNQWGKKLRSFCTADDYWCASGNDANAGNIHAQEVQTWGSQAADFVVKTVKGN